MEKATVYIYESLKDYAKCDCVVMLNGVTGIHQSVAGGYGFEIGEEQHVFPSNIIFLVVVDKE